MQLMHILLNVSLAYQSITDISNAPSLLLVHKQVFYIRINLLMLQHSNVKCNIQIFILCSKLCILVILWSWLLALVLNLYLLCI